MLNPDFRDILSAFNAQHVDYLVVGAYAVAAHGLPRATGDIDLWIRPSPDNAERVWKALAEFGAPMDRLSLEDLSQPAMVIQLGVAPQRIDVLTSIDGVDFATAWAGRLAISVDGLQISVLGRRDLLVNKRASGRPQDLADIARLEELSESQG
jgi:hypothetical protein